MKGESTMLTTKILGLATAGLLSLSLAGCGDDSAPQAEPRPAPSTTAASASSTPTEVAGPVPTHEPAVPYILGGRLHVDGKTVAGGPFWQVRSGPRAWIAVDTANHWWWGRGPKAMAIEASIDDVPVISANGT